MFGQAISWALCCAFSGVHIASDVNPKYSIEMEIKRLSDICHKLPEGKTQEDYRYALSDKIFCTKQLSLYSEKVPPGQTASSPHFHSDTDEIVHITKGELYAIEGTKETILNAGDTICFFANSQMKHHLENRSNTDATFLIFKCSTSKSDAIY